MAGASVGQENWSAVELLPKLDVPTDVITHIKTAVAEELFDNFRVYYGDDPERYNISFEAIFGIYCNRMEWVHFLSTALASSAHAIKFDDLNKLTTGKMLFYIQVPRVATGAGIPTSRQTTIMVTKHSEKSPITIPFELSAACLTHLREAFESTLLDRLLNIEALNTVIRAVRNTADAMERGLVNCFLETLLRRSPPYFVVRTLLENATLNRQTLTRVQRSNIMQSFKSKMLDTLFIFNRTRDRGTIVRFLSRLLESVTESILDNPEIYVTSSGIRLSGVLVSTANVIQTLTTILDSAISKESVRTPASYGRFVLSKENAVTAVAHHAIMADFQEYANRIGQDRGQLNDSEFLDQNPSFTQLSFDVLTVGEKAILIEHLRRVYKNTDAKDPLEKEIDLTFFFPLGLFIGSDQKYTTVENKVRLVETAQTELPITVYFYDKNQQLRHVTYADCLRTLCHPVFNDATLTFQMFRDAGPPTEDHIVERLCNSEFQRDSVANAPRRILFFYQTRREPPRTTNEIKNDYGTAEFLKPENDALYTELHPLFDFTHYLDGLRVRELCTPRILVGNLPEPLAPFEFQEARARQMLELSKAKPPVGAEAALNALHVALTDPSYPELFYLIDVMTHGDFDAMSSIRTLLARCANNYYLRRQGLAFAHNYDLLVYVGSKLGDTVLVPGLQQLYRQVLALLSFLQRVSAMTNLHGVLAEEPLIAYVSALHDGRLLPPFLSTLPRHMPHVQVVVDQDPLSSGDFQHREPLISSVQRLAQADSAEPLFVDQRRLSDEELLAHKIYYLCVIPALTNNRALGCGLRVKDLLVHLFYDLPFLVVDDQAYRRDQLRNPLLIQLLRDIAVDVDHDVHHAGRELFAAVPYVAEHTQILEFRAYLDPAQRHGVGADFMSLQHVLYNGICITSPMRLLAPFVEVMPFHRFYSDPNLAANMQADIRNYLQQFPHLQRHDGSFPLAPMFAHEYHNWHRTPFSKYTAHCPNTLSSILTLIAMHHKFSPVSTTLQSRLRLHPGFALTIVRTDTFEAETLMYSAKSCSALIINNPIVTKEDQDISTTYHVSQNISTIDMGLGYSSATCVANLRRVRSDMGARIQDFYRIFPMHVHRDDDVDTWLRQTTGAERTDLLDPNAISMLTFGGLTDNGGSFLLHGQRPTCELIPTPVVADINFFRQPNNPRGRSSCLIGADPYDDAASQNALYNHKELDPQTFSASTQNPWASQKGSLGDVLYNTKHRDRLGTNASFYSPCAQYFTESTIVASNKTLFKTIDDYMVRAQDCIRGDTDVQYICVEGTNELVEKPCTFLQEAIPIQSSTTQALLEAQSKTPRPESLNETHYSNYCIRETIPFQQSILFNT